MEGGSANDTRARGLCARPLMHIQPPPSATLAQHARTFIRRNSASFSRSCLRMASIDSLSLRSELLRGGALRGLELDMHRCSAWRELDELAES
jgi:hypothetical protein